MMLNIPLSQTFFPQQLISAQSLLNISSQTDFILHSQALICRSAKHFMPTEGHESYALSRGAAFRRVSKGGHRYPRLHTIRWTVQSLWPTVLQEFKCLTSTELILLGTENLNILFGVFFLKKIRSSPQFHLSNGPGFTQDCLQVCHIFFWIFFTNLVTV